MRFYRITAYVGDDQPSFCVSLDEAREHSDPTCPDTRVELVDFPITQAGVLDLLRGNLDAQAVRTWMFTPRGALKEVPNGE